MRLTEIGIGIDLTTGYILLGKLGPEGQRLVGKKVNITAQAEQAMFRRFVSQLVGMKLLQASEENPDATLESVDIKSSPIGISHEYVDDALARALGLVKEGEEAPKFVFNIELKIQ